MSPASAPAPVVKVKPQPNVYTLLLVIAIVVLCVTLAFVINNLTVNYGFQFKDLFGGQTVPPLPV
jgi:hypothetical protein